MKVPILDLSEQYRFLERDIHRSLSEVMSNSRFILGENVKRLERDISRFSGSEFGIGVGNGSDALHLSLLACDVKAGDEVITTAFTFFATAGAIARVGAKPVFVDINPDTFNMDVQQIENKITSRTKAIIPVHLYGQCTEMDPILDLASQYNLVVIEDAAQAIGATYKGKRAGELGTTACFSFFPTKNLGAYGDGGMIVTNDPQLADKIGVLRVHGSKPKYYHHVLGYNSRLDELQAAILNVKFPYMERWIALRQEKASFYNHLLGELRQVILPQVHSECNHVFHQYTIKAQQRDELQEYLKSQNIETVVYYPKPLHLQPVFDYLGYQEGDLPNTEIACREVLSLPMYPEISESQQEYVASCILGFYRNS
ncbi:DegT/DnrJ/EryC1/StrS family aminotransferase [Cohnella cellulosilytica]|uniref:DegT/DnrJ/EryC1/StrS family aminotransferase n=1 Tax=Cohnella cellulosilytica TaxID=986710 RepID=A0ABW2FD12_9BACL